MLNVQLSDRYDTAHGLLLEDDSFNEEVVAEVSKGAFTLTCSLGIDKKQGYITWNLRFYDQFLDHKTLFLRQLPLDVFNRKELVHETQYKFRQFLWKAVNRSGEEAIAAQQIMTKWEY